MKIVFLDAGTFYGSPDLSRILRSFGELKLHNCTNEIEVLGRISDAEIVLTNKVVLNENSLSQCPQLKLVCVTATGMNNIDLEAAKRYGITVKNAAGYSTHSVAQTTIAMALQLLMQLDVRNAFARKKYNTHPYFTHLNPGFSEINGKTWGIIGLGAIGEQVASIAKAFGAKIVYHSPSGRNVEAGYKHLSLTDLLATSDIISIHTPLNEYTINLISANELKLCKPSVILINVARGGIVDEFALANALNNGTIASAAVDVYKSEPIEPFNPLLHLFRKTQVVLTPHIAWGSYEARQKLMEITRQNIIDYIESK